ncbi:MAG TPA: sulfite exporter TauE/SafE family protein [Gaiellaceae bacterium]|nr:sulfite exporter TauE/SafE family protein [Gaiellaceae bacterium]
MHTLIILALVGFLAQLVDGALGMAYGATSTTLVLSAGYSPVVASASVHLAELGTTAVSGVSHWRFGNVDWRTVRRIAFPGAVGAFAGATVLGHVSAELAKPWMAGVLLALGTYILVRFTLRGLPQRSPRAPRRRFLMPLGLAGGFVDATGGGGWGPVTTPTLLLTGRMEPRKVVGSVDTSEFLVALAASAGFLLALGTQVLAAPIVVGLLAGGVVAAPLAAWLVRKMTARLLGTLVGGFIVLTNARTLFSAIDEPIAVRTWVYAGIVLAWSAAVATVVRAHRRTGAPLWHGRRGSEPAFEGA